MLGCTSGLWDDVMSAHAPKLAEKTNTVWIQFGPLDQISLNLQVTQGNSTYMSTLYPSLLL